MADCGLFWPILAHFRPFSAGLGIFGLFVGRFWPMPPGMNKCLIITLAPPGGRGADPQVWAGQDRGGGQEDRGGDQLGRLGQAPATGHFWHLDVARYHTRMSFSTTIAQSGRACVRHTTRTQPGARETVRLFDLTFLRRKMSMLSSRIIPVTS